jgi:hypothetical protein
MTKRKRWLLIECEADAKLYCAKEGCPGIPYREARDVIEPEPKPVKKAKSKLPVVIDKPA